MSVDETARIIGYIAIVAASLGVAILAGVIAVDAFRCARFIWRVRRALRDAGDKLGDWKLLKAWARYWLGIEPRPQYLILNSNDEAVYWPGHEGSRRYPA